MVSVADGLEPVDGDVAPTGGDEVPPVEGVEEVGELAGRLPVPVDVDMAVDDVDVDAPVPLADWRPLIGVNLPRRLKDGAAVHDPTRTW